MKIYLVGGAVRDEALGLPVHERDWVVVGGTPEALRAQGYRQVGRDFPVFLHPKTQEEYALARMERKLAPGYYGFTCDFNPQVTLEEDLARRDLTINAMAKDASGELIDPYHGMRDLAAKRLRHVSPAFVEDPVRVLRVARFSARYHHLGFQLADETRTLMSHMVRQGELAHLVAERVWQEWQRALGEKDPVIFIQILRACGALRVILPELDALFGVPNASISNESVDTGMNMLRRLAHTAEMFSDPVIRFAALLLFLGKAHTRVEDWPLHTGYEERSVHGIDALCARLRIPHEYRELAGLSARFHACIQQGMQLGAEEMVGVLEQTDAFRRPERFHALLSVSEAWCDSKQQTLRWQRVLDACRLVSTKELCEQYRGEAIKAALHACRVACVERQLNQWINHEK